MRDAHPLARLRLETAWSNQMAWNLARVVNFCYDGNEVYGDMRSRIQHWEELWELVQTWMRDRPAGFNPIYQGPIDDSGSFPNTWFTADWHGKIIQASSLTVSRANSSAVSFCYYHFACIMLLRFRPHSDSVAHDGHRLSKTDVNLSVFHVQD